MSAPRRYPLIFNPLARSQKGARALLFLARHEDRFELHATATGQEASDLARRFAEEGEPVVIAAGGDGTLNAVVRGLAGSRTALGVMPAGTMNVFARELGIPSNSLAKAFDVIEQGLIREVDLFSANGAPFFQMAGVGFDAMVIEETKWESKRMLGPLAYLLSAVKVLGEKPSTIEVITAEGVRETGVAMLCGNGSLYGGQFRLFRNASNTDSLLDVIVFKEAGYRFVLDSLTGIARGGIDLASSTACFQTGGIRVTSETDFPVQIDGELLGRFKEIDFREAPPRLRVLAPEKSCGTPIFDTLRTLLQWPARLEQTVTKAP